MSEKASGLKSEEEKAGLSRATWGFFEGQKESHGAFQSTSASKIFDDTLIKVNEKNNVRIGTSTIRRKETE